MTGSGEMIVLRFAFLSLTLLFQFIRYPRQLLGRLLLGLVADLKRLRVGSNRFLNKVRIRWCQFWHRYPAGQPMKAIQIPLEGG